MVTRNLKHKLTSTTIFTISIILLISPKYIFADVPVRIMPLGDSITKGVGTTPYNGYRKPLYINLTNNGYNIDFVGGETHGDFNDLDHEGHSSWRADQIRDNVSTWLVNNPADIVLLHIGTNDITGGNQDVNEVNDILINIDGYSEQITVILALIINRQSYSPATAQFNNDVNDMALNRIANGDDIILVDMENALSYPDDLADPVHPNDSGYAKMADVWFNALDGIIAPTITSTPVTTGIVEQLYTYNVDATGYPEPNYTLIEYPNNMTIEPNTGLIEWIPDTPGDFNVTVQAGNGQPSDANQDFTITAIFGGIEFDATSSAYDGNDGNTLSWSHTVGNGDNRILVVGVSAKDNGTSDLDVNSVAYGSATMTLVAGSTSTAGTGSLQRTALYYLLSPSSGANTVTVTYSGPVNARSGGAVSLSNVAQQPPEAVDTNSNVDLNSISTSITTQTNGAWAVDVVGCGTSGSFSTTTAGMLEWWDVSPNNSSGAGSTKLVPLAGSTTMSWQHSGANRLAHSVAAFAPITHIISGYIREPNDAPVEGVSMSVNGGGSDVTDANGYYETSVPYNWSGKVAPVKTGLIFAPPERTYTSVIIGQSGQDYQDISIYDLDFSGFIGWGDVNEIGEYWLETGEDLPGDFYKDEYDTVNFLDFADFANVWGN